MKEVIFPLYVYFEKLGLLEKKLKVSLYTKINYFIIWRKTFEYIFPNVKFTMNNGSKPKEFDIEILYYWSMVKPGNKKKYNQGIRKKDLDSFCQYLEKVIPKPKDNCQYDIILIKRSQKPISQYYESLKNNKSTNRALKGVTEGYKYIKNAWSVYQLICSEFPSKSVLQVDLVDLDFPQRFHYFRNAKVLIGQHGAALVQSMFMKDDSHVIEYVNKTYYQMGFSRQICMARKIKYHYCIYPGSVFRIIDIDRKELIDKVNDIYKGKYENQKEFPMKPL